MAYLVGATVGVMVYEEEEFGIGMVTPLWSLASSSSLHRPLREEATIHTPEIAFMAHLAQRHVIWLPSQ